MFSSILALMETALVTGASSGIGLEFAKIHAQKGGDLVLVARSEQKLMDLKEQWEKEYQVSVKIISKDLSGENAAKEVFDELSEMATSVQILINNAGVGDSGQFGEGELWRYQQMIQLNITSLTDLCYYFVKQLESKNQGGRILNVASTAAFQGIPHMAVYSGTKAYVLSFSEALAGEYVKKGISVTALCPGPTKTEFASNANMKASVMELPIFPSGKEVAEFGYKKMMQGEVVAVHGLLNKAGVQSTRLFSRTGVGKIMGEFMKRTADK